MTENHHRHPRREVADLQSRLQGVDLLVEGGRELPDLLFVADVLQAELVLVLHVYLLHAHLQVPHLQVLRDKTEECHGLSVTGLWIFFCFSLT